MAFRFLRINGLFLVLACGFFERAPVLTMAADKTRSSQIVLNEIMYHPPEDRDDLQFIELFNPDTNSVDLSGWSLSQGVKFDFQRGTVINGGGFAVICRDIPAFKAHYGFQGNLAGAFTGELSHKGKPLTLADAQGRVVETIDYADRQPWPLGADGYGASLERICPFAPGNDPSNWASSEFISNGRAGGTPGGRNSCYSGTPLPQITELHFGKAEPEKPFVVTANVKDAAGIQAVTLHWAAWKGDGAATWNEVPMERRSGDAFQGSYAGSIPAQSAERLIRFKVRAASVSGVERLCPAKTEPRPTFSFSTYVNTNTAHVPFLRVQTAGTIERPGRSRRMRAVVQAGVEAPGEPGLPWSSTAVYLPAHSTEVRIFDHVHVRPRKGGLKVHFHKDQMFKDMTGINVIFESSPRWVLSEPLSFELFRRAGVPSPLTEHVRCWLNGQPLGYYLLIEQPNKAFLRRQGWDEDGNLYKLLWYEWSLIGQHEKKINARTGHQDLVQLIEALKRTSDMEQWDIIQQHFNVDEMINYYAVSMCIQNWDGFWNNYYAYHNLRPGGKWAVIPWDEDKTWGDYDGASPQHDWYDMPLTFGMTGGKPVKDGWLFSSGPFGGVAWWRPPGYFSGPLLANPEFRRRFLSRLGDICQTVFTPEHLGPFIDEMEKRLEPEVAVRAHIAGQNPESRVHEFHQDMQSFRNQTSQRRLHILNQLKNEKQ